jgi:pentatricopeptide repeat protein
MLPTLRITSRKSERLSVLFPRKQPFKSTKQSSPFIDAVAGSSRRSFSWIISCQGHDTSTTRRSFADISYARPNELPDDAQSFLDELESYAHDGSAISSKAKLKKLVKKYRYKLYICRMLLQKSLEFEQQHPDRRGRLVDADCTLYVIRNCVIHKQMERAYDILALCQSLCAPLHPHCVGIVMNGYAQQETITPFAIQRIEQMLQSLEDNHNGLQNARSPLNCHKYNMLMNAYMNMYGTNSLSFVKKTMERMNAVAERLEDDSLRPNPACYTTLIKAFILQGRTGFALEVQAILDQVKADSHYLEKHSAKDQRILENVVMDAWSKSGDPHAAKRAKQIFDAMNMPDTIAYNTLCNTYAAVGDLQEVFGLYRKMQADFESGENKHCRPDCHTYNTVLNAMQKSNGPNAVEMADQFFTTIPSPDRITCNTLLNIYTQNGNVKKALSLLKRMQSGLEKGEDSSPDTDTFNTIPHALQQSKQSDATENALPSPDTKTYNTLLILYAQNGQVDSALELVRRMQSDYASGKNRDCQPTLRTFNILLNVLQKSNRSDAAEITEQIFTNMAVLPDTITFNTLINLYAERGMGKDAVSLARRMQRDYESGRNPNCMPSEVTKRTILKAIRLAKDDALKKDARDVVEWVHKQTAI